MREYKKSYVGFWIWMLVWCVVFFAICFLPIHNTQILIALCDNIMTMGCFVLTLIVYLSESVYWYNGTSFEEAKNAGRVRRKRFALEHMKRFGIFAALFLLYSIVSILLKLPYGLDITVVTVGIVVVALSTIPIKL